jgi:hypothetical protein
MLFHASIPADQPERVARVLAQIWRGHHMPSPGRPGQGFYIAFALDDRGTEIEFCPRGLEHFPAPNERDFQKNSTPSSYSECHFAMATPLTEDEVIDIVKREGWTVRRCDRGGAFEVIEIWLENKFMIEVLPERMQRQYLEFMRPAHLRTFFEPTA